MRSGRPGIPLDIPLAMEERREFMSSPLLLLGASSDPPRGIIEAHLEEEIGKAGRLTKERASVAVAQHDRSWQQ